MPKTEKRLKLKSPSWVFIDWANVYNLGREIFQIKKGIYKCPIDQLGNLVLKKVVSKKGRRHA